MSEIEKFWTEYTLEDWSNAVFCEECKFPMMMVEDEKGRGHYECSCCTWEEDQSAIVHGLKNKIVMLEEALDTRQEVYDKLLADYMALKAEIAALRTVVNCALDVIGTSRMRGLAPQFKVTFDKLYAALEKIDTKALNEAKE